MTDITAEDAHEVADNHAVLFRTEESGQSQSGECQRIVEKHLKRGVDIRFYDELQDAVGQAGDQSGSGSIDVADQADEHHGK